MKRFSLCFMAMAMLAGAVWAAADGAQYRLYDDLAAFVSNPDGKDFTVTLEIRDINHIARGPSELLVRIYAPDGRRAVREVIADDGVAANTSGPLLTGWDQEAWYYSTRYSGGMHVSQWRTFHIHSIVGTTADGQPLVTANSEHFNARLTGDTVTSSGEVRQSSVRATR